MPKKKHMTYMKPFNPAGRRMLYINMLHATPRDRTIPPPWRGLGGYTVAVVMLTLLASAKLWGML